MGDANSSRNTFFVIAIGLLAGFGSALLGIGGGVVIVPLLTLLLRMNIKLAAGASVAAIVPAAMISVGTEVFKAPENFQLLHSGLLFAGAFVGVRIGSAIQNRIPERELAWAFALVLLLTALRLGGVFGNPSGAGIHDSLIDSLGIAHGASMDLLVTYLLVALLGMIGGMASPLFGLGGGVLFIPGLMLLFTAFASDYPIARAASLVTVLLTSAYACRIQHLRRKIPWPTVKILIPGTVCGAVVGLLVYDQIDAAGLRTVMSFVLGLAALRMALTRRAKE